MSNNQNQNQKPARPASPKFNFGPPPSAFSQFLQTASAPVNNPFKSGTAEKQNESKQQSGSRSTEAVKPGTYTDGCEPPKETASLVRLRRPPVLRQSETLANTTSAVRTYWRSIGLGPATQVRHESFERSERPATTTKPLRRAQPCTESQYVATTPHRDCDDAKWR